MDDKLTKKEKTQLRRVLGVGLMALGIAGLVLPILPGWLLIFIGLELVGIELVFFEKIKTFCRKKLKIDQKN